MPMNRLPQRVSLVAQTAAIITDAIKSGRWESWLPGEHELCAQLHVSRKTLRAALKQLSRKGIIKCSQGQRRRIVKRRASLGKPASNRVVALLPLPLQSVNPLSVFLIDHLREHLADCGYVLETHSSRVPYRSGKAHGLKNLVETLHPAGWVLLQSTEAMQKWFAAQGLPCLVIGSRYEGVDLPSVDRDYAEICQHAVNQFVARGHLQLVLLSPTPASAGDVVTTTKFLEAVKKSKATGVTGIVQEHDGTIPSICSRVDQLLSRPQPPTAFLVSRARHILTVLGYLLTRSVRVPKDVALIARDDESFLADVVPSVARYSLSERLFASKISHAVMEVVKGDARIKEHKLMPTFIKGSTLG